MHSHSDRLPQLDGSLYLTDGGIETTLIFREGIELPHFAAFHLLSSGRGVAALRRYYLAYAGLALRYRTGLVLESPTWRASADWGERLGYDRAALGDVNRRAIELLEPLRARLQEQRRGAVISGCIGPRGDGYVPGRAMTAYEARGYHARSWRRSRQGAPTWRARSR